MKTIIGIRCKTPGKTEMRLYNQLLSFFSADDIYLIVDGDKFSGGNNVSDRIILAQPDKLGMTVCPDWGWRCGDLFYYAFAEKVEADFYYLVESDVWFTKATGQALFSGLSRSHADFIAHDIHPIGDAWLWHSTIRPFFPKVHACAFPFTRLSRRAIAFLQEQRRIINHFCHLHDRAVPNDESFVTSALNSQGFHLSQMGALSQVNTSRFSAVYQIPFEFCKEDDYLYHSALEGKEFYSKFLARLFNDQDADTIQARFDYAFGGNMDAHSYFAVLRQILPAHLLTQFNAWHTGKLVEENLLAAV